MSLWKSDEHVRFLGFVFYLEKQLVNIMSSDCFGLNDSGLCHSAGLLTPSPSQREEGFWRLLNNAGFCEKSTQEFHNSLLGVRTYTPVGGTGPHLVWATWTGFLTRKHNSPRGEEGYMSESPHYSPCHGYFWWSAWVHLKIAKTQGSGCTCEGFSS